MAIFLHDLRGSSVAEAKGLPEGISGLDERLLQFAISLGKETWSREQWVKAEITGADTNR